MLKKTLCVLLAAAMALCSLTYTVSADTSYSQDVSVVNGVRHTDYLVIYTASYGTTTKTNIYGFEVTVTNGTVTAVGGNDSAIPSGSNSFVVSGHGTMKEWLSDTVIVGMKAEYSSDEGRIYFTKDRSTLLYALNSAAEKASASKQNAKEACLVYSITADGRFAAAEAKRANASDMSEPEINALIEEYNTITYLYREREVSEYRGVWLRPTQTSTEQVRSYVKQCYDAGINMISIETMYAGTMIYPVPDNSLFEQNPIFNGFDVLDAFTEICHEYGIELHCWMPVFYSCSNGGVNYRLSPAYKKPEWQLITNNGSPIYSYESTGMVFLNPANDDVQNFLAETYTHILNTYDIDGFQLDYIRYRDRYGNDDFGYDEITISKFKQEYPEYKNTAVTFDTNALYWNDWVAFRAAQVTKFVERMRGIIDSIAPDVVLSADVGVSVSDAYRTIYQDSIAWLENGWLDMLHPMAYGEGYSRYAEQFLNAAGDECMVIPGLGIFMDEFDGSDMAFQADEMSAVGCGGVVYFQTAQYFGKNANEVLSETLYTDPAIAPALDNTETFGAIIKRFRERIALASENKYITSAEAEKLTALAESAISAAGNSTYNAYPVLEQIKGELSELNAGALRERLERDIRNAGFAVLRDKVPFLLGDVNENGEIEKYDYILVRRAVMNTVALNGVQRLAADVNKGGDVEKFDYILIKRHVMKTYTIEG